LNHRIVDEIPGWASTGRVDIDDFENFLIRKRIVGEDDIVDLDITGTGLRNGKSVTVAEEDDDFE
jgi:hypothetical protein